MTTRILLADDHEIVRQGLRLLLQREGFEVIGEAANGQDAIRLARENCPDVAVLDYGMPLLNGIGAAREIMQRSEEHTSELQSHSDVVCRPLLEQNNIDEHRLR